jgi:tRNA-dependent cyclodipeptide synthase
MMLDSLFVPICMYTRFFKRTENFRRFTEEVLQPSRRAFIVVADDLNAYNLINRGFPETIAFHNARTEGANVETMIRRIIDTAGLGAHVQVCRWATLTADDDYRSLYERLRMAFDAEPVPAALLQKFVVHHARRMGWQQTKRELEWETRYILEEIAASVLLTEVRGFSAEIWEKIPGPLDPDPLRDLYRDHADLLSQLTGRPVLQRRLHSLVEATTTQMVEAAV